MSSFTVLIYMPMTVHAQGILETPIFYLIMIVSNFIFSLQQREQHENARRF